MIYFNICIICLGVVLMFFIYNLYKEPTYTQMSFKENFKDLNLPIITFYSNNIPLNFLLDSGSNTNVIDKRLLEKLNCKDSDNNYSKIGVDGNISKEKSCYLTINYKGIEYSDEYNVSDLENLVDNIELNYGITIHGILGSNFFHKYKYIIDFNKLKIYVKK